MRGDNPGEFTASVRRALVTAEEEARALNHHSIGPEHLLLGLIAVPDSIGGQVLAEVGVTADAARIAIVSIAGSAAVPVAGEIGLDEYAQRVVGQARKDAERDEEIEIDSHYLLIALLEDRVVRHILSALGYKPLLIPERTTDAVLQAAIRPPPEDAEMRVWGTVADMERLAMVARREDRIANDLVWDAVERALASVVPEGTANVVALAREEAALLDHARIQPSHLLLGLLRYEGSIGRRILIGCGATLTDLRAAVAAEGVAEETEPVNVDGVTESGYQAIQWASRGTGKPDTRLLLIALLDAETGVIAVMARAGINAAAVKRAAHNGVTTPQASRLPGGEMLMRGTPEQIDRLARLADRLYLPLADVVWEALRLTWFVDESPATDE